VPSDGPAINGAGNTVTYTGTPVLLDPSVAVSDTTTISSVNVWISSGFQSGDQLTINGNADGIINDSDGSTIHYHYDSSAHGIYLYTATGTATLSDFDAALQSIQFSATGSDPTVGGTDLSRTITWAAQDSTSATSPTVTTTVDLHIVPVLNSFTLTISEGGTTVLSNSDFSVSDPGFTNFTYRPVKKPCLGSAPRSSAPTILRRRVSGRLMRSISLPQLGSPVNHSLI
jgi:hypothetical protein